MSASLTFKGTMALRAILFDIDDTLYSTTEFARRARRNAVPADLKKRWQEIDQKKYSHLKIQTAAREIEKEAGGGFVFGTIADHLRVG